MGDLSSIHFVLLCCSIKHKILYVFFGYKLVSGF